MKVLFLAAEATPLAKVGGLADVAGELPRALRYLGMDLRLCLPFHTTIDRNQYELREIAKVEVAHDHAFHLATIFETQIGEVTVWLVDGPPVEASPGVYGELTRDAAKYTFTNLALFTLCEMLDWIPEILHANDWHAAVAVMYLKKLREHDARWARTSSLFTIHNLPYMGLGAEQVLASYKVPILASTLLPEWAQKAPLPQGILQADWVSTVSPTYALEIQTPEFGSGIEALLEARRENLSGILNGIDPGVWNPGEDQTLARPFTLETLGKRGANKAALQAELALEVDPRIPLIGMVTRVDSQKGVDLVWPALECIGETPWQFVFVGTGDPKLEQLCQAHAEKLPQRVRVVLRFDPPLARRIYAGSDMLLIPSRYEPCGLAQMIAMRYGSVPVVRATGGLLDSVKDLKSPGGGTGFVFQDPSFESLQQAIGRALECYQQPQLWEQLQRNGMSQDFSWRQSARDYERLYQRIGDLHAA